MKRLRDIVATFSPERQAAIAARGEEILREVRAEQRYSLFGISVGPFSGTITNCTCYPRAAERDEPSVLDCLLETGGSYGAT